MLTLFADNEQSLEFDDLSLALYLLNKKEEREKRFMLLRVRVKGLLADLTEQTNVDFMPVPLIIFLNNITQNGNYVPDNFLTPYQLNRIDTDNYGAIISLDESQIKMVAGTYLFARILIFNILLKATDTNAG